MARPTTKNRFIAKIAHAAGNCWIWQGGRHYGGLPYGKFWMSGKDIAAHRAAWLLFKGDIQDGLFVCHRCDVAACVNPDHLFLGTPQDNSCDMVAKGRNSVRRGTASNFAKLRDEDIVEIRRSSDSQRAVARRFGISQSAVSLIRRGINWKHING